MKISQEERRKLKSIRLGKKEKEILGYIGVGTFVLASMVVPGLPMAVAPLIPGNKYSKYNAKRCMKALEDKDLISLSGDLVKLTSKGKKLMHLLQSEEFTIETAKRWDGLWRVVAYDIPDTAKKEREYFRKKLLQNRFQKVQESMFAFPYECKEELAVFAHSIGVSSYVVFLVTDHLPRQAEYMRKFKLNLED